MKFDFIPDSVSHFDNAYDVLKERGFIEQSTNEDEIRTAVSGNICRCTGYTPIITAIEAAANQAD